VLKTKLWPKEEATENGENFRTKSFTVCTLQQMLLRSPNQGVMRQLLHLQCCGKIRNGYRIWKSEHKRPLCEHRNTCMLALRYVQYLLASLLHSDRLARCIAVLAAIPARRESQSTRLSEVLSPLILRFINHIYRRRWKWFPWAHRHVSHLTITLFVAHRSFLSYASRREVTNESCQIK